MSRSIAHYCQNCRSANTLGQDFCARCGTRLMIIVEPSSARFEAADSSLSSNEHLLERVSATENRIARLAERLERGLDLVLRQVQNSHYDRTLVTALVDLLAADGLIDKARLEQIWNERCRTDSADGQTSPDKQSGQRHSSKPRKKRPLKRTRN